MRMVNSYGDIAPLLGHDANDWDVEMIERRYLNGELYYVDSGDYFQNDSSSY